MPMILEEECAAVWRSSQWLPHRKPACTEDRRIPKKIEERTRGGGCTHPPSGRALALGPLTREPAAARGEPTRPCGRPSRARHEAAPARERSRAHSTRGADTHTTPESSTRDGISLTFVAEHIVHRRCTQHVLHMSHCTCTSCAHRTCNSRSRSRGRN